MNSFHIDCSIRVFLSIGCFMTKLCINVQYGCLILFVMTIIHGLVIIVMFKFIVVHLLVFQDGDLMVLTFVYSIATEIYATYNKNIFLSFFFFFF